jgi:hypothetical protein
MKILFASPLAQTYPLSITHLIFLHLTR